MRKPWGDLDACNGCALCAANVPEVFRMADHGKAEAYDPGSETEDTIRQEAMDICPVSCIYWQD
jgi:ferredoxin